MKTLLPLLLTLMLSLPVSAREPYAYIPSVGDGYIIRYYEGENGKFVYLSPDQVGTDEMIPVYCLSGFKTPIIHIEYESVKTMSSPTARLKTVLNGSRRPKIIVRIPDKCGDADFIRTIEYKLSMLGLDVLDHTLAEGATTPKAIAQKSGADILLDVSWLEFSNPDMATNMKKGASKIKWDEGFTSQSICSQYIVAFKFYKKGVFDNKERDRFLSKSINKGRFPEHKEDWLFVKLNNVFTDGLNDEIINELEYAGCFAKNDNVISTIFRFIDLRSGSLLCQFHVGYTDQQLVEISSARFDQSVYETGIKGLCNYGNGKNYSTYIRNPNNNEIYWIDPWNKERYNTFDGSNEAAWILTYIATQLNNGEIPYAKQLNNFQSVKIADEQILEQGSSRSTTNTGYSGHGGTNYYYRFNRSYWSGGSRSTTNTTSSNTTTFKDAEYIRPQDFYGYYAPLTDKLCEELQKLLS